MSANAWIAQSVEQRIRNAKVVSSILASGKGTSFINYIYIYLKKILYSKLSFHIHI